MKLKKPLVFIIILIVIVMLFLLIRGISGMLESRNKGESSNIVTLDLSMLIYVPTTKYKISENELQQRKLGALSGDTKSALAVSYHCVHRVGYDETIEWFTIGAENGEPEIQYALADRLINFSDNDPDCETRGIFWLYMAIKNEYKIKESEALLKELDYTPAKAQPPADKRFPDRNTQLDENELAAYKTGALQGNMKAALFLGKYYDEITVDSELSEYWYRIGAQNGSSECKYRLGQIMIWRNSEHDQIRGRFWLEQAAGKRD
jgi:TPR repeat protein